MATMDAIRPPQKATKKTAGTTRRPQYKRQPLPAPALRTEQPQAPATAHKNRDARELHMWLIVSGIMVAIIAGWILLAANGKLFSGGDGTGLESIGGKLSNLWNTIQQDVLKLKEKTSVPVLPSTLTPEQQRIKDLENEIFPQFSNTNSAHATPVNTNALNANTADTNQAPPSNTNQQ